MTTDTEQSNGKTPGKVKKSENKRLRYDATRDLDSSIGSDADEVKDALRNEKQKNKDLTFQIGKMQKQLQDLTKQIENLTELMSNLQKEKSQLLEIMQKKSPTKTVKKSRKQKKNTPISTQAPKPSEAHVSVSHNSAVANEGDDNSASTSNEQNPSELLTDVNMSERGNGTIGDVHESSEDDDDALSEEESSSESENERSNHKHKEKRSEATPTNMHTNRNAHTNKRSSKIPPVDIWTDNRSDTQTTIQNALPPNSCLFQRVNNTKFRVLPTDAQTRQKVIEIAKEQKFEYNTYTPSEEKMVNVLIKGLDHIDDSKVIEAALAAKGFAPYKIQKHITGYMRKNSIKSNLWLIVLQPNTDTAELFRIKSIESAIIKFEFLRKPKVIQCKRCQRFNHSASNCQLPYRCVKCTNTHEPGKCLSEAKGNKFKPKCVNCKGNHTANDAANCPEFKRVIELKTSKQKNQTKQNRNKPAVNPSAIRTTQSYADRAKTNQQPKSVNKSETNTIDQFVNNQNQMLDDFMATMKKMQQQFITNFNRTNG